MRQHRLPATIGPDKVVPGVGDFKVEDGFVGESVFGGDDAEGGVVEAAERGAGFELADGDEAAFLEDEEGVGGSSGEGAGLAGGGVLDGEVDEVVGVVAEGADHAVDGLAVEGEGELVVGASFGVEDAAGEGDAFAVVDVAEASVAMGVAGDHDDVIGDGVMRSLPGSRGWLASRRSSGETPASRREGSWSWTKSRWPSRYSSPGLSWARGASDQCPWSKWRTWLGLSSDAGAEFGPPTQ